MKLVEACLSARKDRERSFHQWGGAVKVVQSGLSARKDREGTFHNCGGDVKQVFVVVLFLVAPLQALRELYTGTLPVYVPSLTTV